MKYINIIFFLVLGLIGSNCATGGDIYIDFKAQVPVIKSTIRTVTAKIPCVARIGKCSAELTVIPTGWKLSNPLNGEISIPLTDFQSDKYFLLKGVFSNIYDDQLTASIVCTFMGKIQNNVYGRPTGRVMLVFDKNDYNAQNGQNSEQGGQKGKSNTDTPDALDVAAIRKLNTSIQSGDNEAFMKQIELYLLSPVSCKRRLAFLQKAQELMIRKTNDLQQTIQKGVNTITDNQQTIKDLKQQNKTSIDSLIGDADFKKLYTNIYMLKKQKIQMEGNMLKIKDEADLLIKSISNANKNSKANQDKKAMDDLQVQLKIVEDQIAAANAKRQTILNSIKQKKVQMQKKTLVKLTNNETVSKQQQIIQYNDYIFKIKIMKANLTIMDKKINQSCIKFDKMTVQTVKIQQKIKSAMNNLDKVHNITYLNTNQNLSNSITEFNKDLQTVRMKIINWPPCNS